MVEIIGLILTVLIAITPFLWKKYKARPRNSIEIHFTGGQKRVRGLSPKNKPGAIKYKIELIHVFDLKWDFEIIIRNNSNIDSYFNELEVISDLNGQLNILNRNELNTILKQSEITLNCNYQDRIECLSQDSPNMHSLPSEFDSFKILLSYRNSNDTYFYTLFENLSDNKNKYLRKIPKDIDSVSNIPDQQVEEDSDSKNKIPKWLKASGAFLILILGVLASISGFTGYTLKDLFTDSTQSNMGNLPIDMVDSTNTDNSSEIIIADSLELPYLENEPILDKGIYIRYHYNNLNIGGVNIDTLKINSRSSSGNQLSMRKIYSVIEIPITDEPYIEFSYKEKNYSLEITGSHYSFYYTLKENIKLTMTLRDLN